MTHPTATTTTVPHPEAGSPVPVLEMRGIEKSFPGAHALRSVDLVVGRGEVHGLVGENGAGKSTLVKILSGAYQRDAGDIRIEGTSVSASTPREMIDRGVSVIYQEPSLADHLTTAENIFMGRLPRTRLGLIDWPRLSIQTNDVAEQLGLDLEPTRRVGHLSVAHRQMVEIAKALSRDARLIVLDEPSAVLGDAELEGLLRVIRRLAARGVAFIYISHRLDEVFEITDRVTIMKDGRVVAVGETSDFDHDRLVRLMVGRELGDMYARDAVEPGAEALRALGLERRGVLFGIDLVVREGEIVGIAGLAGAGRTEVLRAIHGADPISAGRIEVFGRPVLIRAPSDAIALGIGLLTEDRKMDGLFMRQPVSANVTISRLSRISARGFLSRARERDIVGGYVRRLGIRTPGVDALVRNLSGGNQQKVIFAKWLLADCRILLIDEPTRGVDVGAKREIYRLLADLAARGVAIVIVSSELPEVLGLSDRVLVMREGRVTAELSRGEATEEVVMWHATHGADDQTARPVVTAG